MSTPPITADAKSATIPLSGRIPNIEKMPSISVGDQIYKCSDYLTHCNDPAQQSACTLISARTYFLTSQKTERSGLPQGEENESEPILITGEQLHHHHVDQRIQHLYIYGSKNVEALIEDGTRILIDTQGLDWPIFSEKRQLKIYLERVYFVITQDSEKNYVLKTNIKGSGGGHDYSTMRGSAKKGEIDVHKLLEKKMENACDPRRRVNIRNNNKLARLLEALEPDSSYDVTTNDNEWEPLAYITSDPSHRKDMDNYRKWVKKNEWGEKGPMGKLDEAIAECKKKHGHLNLEIIAVDYPEPYSIIEATPLHFAIVHNLEDVVSALLQAGANPNYCDDIPLLLPLYIAISHKSSSSIVALLLKHGANAQEGMVIHAIRSCNDSTILRELHKVGMDKTALIEAQNSGLTEAIQRKALGPSRAASESGEKEKEKGKHFSQKATKALWTAIEKRQDPLEISRLIDQNANVNQVRDGKTLLGLAIERNHCVSLLLKMGANPNKSSSQETPLQQAIAKKDISLCNELFKAGANSGKFLERAMQQNWQAGIVWYVEAEIKVSPPSKFTIDGLVMCGRWDLFSQLLNENKCSQLVNPNFGRWILAALDSLMPEASKVVKQLVAESVKQGSRTIYVDNLKSEHYPKLLPLACRLGHIGIMTQLLPILTEADLTSVIYAGHEELFNLVLQNILKKGNVNTKNFPNLLSLACQLGHIGMAMQLLNAGAVDSGNELRLLISADRADLFMSYLQQARINKEHMPKLLSLACQVGHTGLVTQLLSMGVVPTESDVSIAINSDRGELFNLLLQKGHVNNPGKYLADACEAGQKWIALRLMQGSVNPRGEEAHRIYFHSARQGWNDVIKWLGRSGAMISSSPPEKNPLNALFSYHSSTYSKADPESVSVLIRQGADVTQVPKQLRLAFVGVLHDPLQQKVYPLINKIIQDLPNELFKALTQANKTNELKEAVLQAFIALDLVICMLGQGRQDAMIQEEVYQCSLKRLTQVLPLERYFNRETGLFNSQEITAALQSSLLAIEEGFRLKGEQETMLLKQTELKRQEVELRERQIREAHNHAEMLAYEQREQTRKLLAQAEQLEQERIAQLNRLAKEESAQAERRAAENRRIVEQKAKDVENAIWRAKQGL